MFRLYLRMSQVEAEFATGNNYRWFGAGDIKKMGT
jgi:hypothetical protein